MQKENHMRKILELRISDSGDRELMHRLFVNLHVHGNSSSDEHMIFITKPPTNKEERQALGNLYD